MTESSKRFRSRLVLLAGAVLLSACAGENLFTLTGVSGSGPQIDITSPSSNFDVVAGDSVLVQATVSATVGLASVRYAGWYADDGFAAFNSESETLDGVGVANLSTYLTAVSGQAPGDVYIVVEATDQGGAVAADSVKITVN